MAVLTQNRTISMILKVPDVELSPSTSRSNIANSVSIVKLDEISDVESISSMPVYQGSIVRIEPHSDDSHVSDLIIRIPNFQCLPSPTSDTDSRQSTRTKRRAPTCPALYGPAPNLSTTNNTQPCNMSNISQSEEINTKRLTTGLRSLSRAFTQSCKPKRTTSFNEQRTLPSSLPDVEVMNEKLRPSTTKNSKHSVPKLSTPKIFFVKRKHSKMNKQQISSLSSSSVISNETQTDYQYSQIHWTPRSTILTTQYAEIKRNNSPKVTSFLHRFAETDEEINEPRFKTEENRNENIDNNDDDKEEPNDTMRISFDVEQQFAAIAKLIADNPASLNDDESLSNHRYSTISVNVPEIKISVTDYDQENIPSTGISYNLDPKSSSTKSSNRSYRIQTSLLQPDISVIRIGTDNQNTSRIDRQLPEEPSINDREENTENSIVSDWYEITNLDDQTLDECYDVDYQLDPEFVKKQEIQTDNSVVPMKIDLNPREYKNLATGMYLITQNEYEQIESINSIDQQSNKDEDINTKQPEPAFDDTIENKSHSLDDLSRTSQDQTTTFQPETNISSHSSRRGSLQQSNSSDDFTTYNSSNEQVTCKENKQIMCIDDIIPTIDEEYTVVLHIEKTTSQIDSNDFDVLTNDIYEEFKSQTD